MTWPPIAVRLIPAHTGNTPLATYSTRSPTAHPRPYGEHGGGGVLPPIRGGSSPHTRGPYGIRAAGMRSRGSSPHTRGPLLLLSPARPIPAHMGNTYSLFHSERGFQAHSRTHGDDRDSPVALSVQSGSFPHTRGPCSAVCHHHHHHRLIPAHTGNTDHHR